MEKKTSFASIDIAKFLLSFFVIAIHTSFLKTIFPKFNYILTSKIFGVVTPFFFITSGYLVFRKIHLPLEDKDRCYIKKYIFRIFKLYVIWMILYFPIAIYGMLKEEISFSSFMISWIRKFLFVGEGYYSWSLWFLHGLFFSMLFIYFLLKYVGPKEILILGILVFLFGIQLNHALLVGSSSKIINKFLILYTYFFERVRNGFFKGFPFIAIGLFLSSKDINSLGGKIKFFLFFVCIVNMILYIYNIHSSLLLYSSSLFLLILNCNVESSRKTILMRKASILLYLLHMIFVFIFSEFISKNCMFLFLFTSIFSFLTCMIILKLETSIPFLKKLYRG